VVLGGILLWLLCLIFACWGCYLVFGFFMVPCEWSGRGGRGFTFLWRVSFILYRLMWILLLHGLSCASNCFSETKIDVSSALMILRVCVLNVPAV